MKEKIFVSSMLLMNLLTGCASRPDLQLGFEPGSCVFDKNLESAPDWTCAPHELFPKGYWYERGQGHASLEDGNLQYTVAMNNARLELARRARSHVEESFKQRILTDGTSDAQYAEISREILSKVSTDVVLPPTYKEAETYDKQGSFYVLIKVNETDLMSKVKEKENMLLRAFNARLKRASKAEEIKEPVLPNYLGSENAQ